MRYAFTGPTKLLRADENMDWLSTLDSPTEITTGAAPGFDMAVALAALGFYPDAFHRIVIPMAPYAADLVAEWVDICQKWMIRNEIIPGPATPRRGTGAYRARNEILIDHADELIAGVRSQVFYRSGEWMTINLARKANVPVTMIQLAKELIV